MSINITDFIIPKARSVFSEFSIAKPIFRGMKF